MKRFNKTSLGFTLIELLIVISVMALLIGAVALNMPSQGRNARDSRRKVDIEQIRSALELYRTDRPNGNYPGATWQNDLINGGYMSTIPTDPRSGAPYPYTRIPATCTTAGPTFCTSYRITINLEVGGTYSLGPQDIAN